MRRVKLALAGGIALLIAAVVVVMSHSPLSIAGTNAVAVTAPVTTTNGRTSSCQRASLPRETSGIRVSLASGAGPKLRIRVFSQSRLLTQGERAAGWGLWANVIVPVKALPYAVPNARICVAVARAPEPLEVLGKVLGRAPQGKVDFKDVELRLEYMRPGSKSWWQLAGSIARHMGFGRAPGGLWAAVLALMLALAVLALAARLVVEELR